jgi:hypothetical protein
MAGPWIPVKTGSYGEASAVISVAVRPQTEHFPLDPITPVQAPSGHSER